jgi:hypothetical protein
MKQAIQRRGGCPWASIVIAASGLLLAHAYSARASTYVVFIPLDDPIYTELDTLDGLGLLYTYLEEIKPLSRIEAARLTVEAEDNYRRADVDNELARTMIHELREALTPEIGWVESNREDGPPTMFKPIERTEVEYAYSSGARRFWLTSNDAGIHAREEAPLMPDADGMPIAGGSNEIVRASAWAGLGGFFTLYGEPAIAGSTTHTLNNADHLRLLDGEAVLSLGNWAFSFGQEEMWWGTGHWAPLTQGDNAAPIIGLRAQNVHPKLLPGVFRYLGQYRSQFIFGQIDGPRPFLHPWIFGHIASFKPLPNFEFGLTRTIAFGGHDNNNYGIGGFFGRLTGINTGNPNGANTNSRGGGYLKFRFPKLRGLIVYQEIMGEDNLTKEIPGIGRFMPLLSVSYQGGFYLPRLSADGRTSLRFEYTILEPNYSVHDDSLYWVTSSNYMMGDPLGPNASRVDVSLQRWLTLKDRAESTVFFTDRAPTYDTNAPYPAEFYGSSLTKEYSVGMTLDFAHFLDRYRWPAPGQVWIKGEASFEYVDHLNYAGGGSLRTFLSLRLGLRPAYSPLTLQ